MMMTQAEAADLVRADAAALLAKLSYREREHLMLRCKGLRVHEVAKVSGVTINTANDYAERAMAKLGVNSMTEAAYIAGIGGLRV